MLPSTGLSGPPAAVFFDEVGVWPERKSAVSFTIPSLLVVLDVDLGDCDFLPPRAAEGVEVWAL